MLDIWRKGARQLGTVLLAEVDLVGNPVEPEGKGLSILRAIKVITDYNRHGLGHDSDGLRRVDPLSTHHTDALA